MHFDFAFLTNGNYGATLLAGAVTTVRLFAGAWLLGFALALVLVVLRAVPWRPLQAVVIGFVEYHRNVPTVVQIMVWYFGMPQILPEGLRLWINHGDTEFMFGLIALGLNVSGFMCEDIRAGLRAIPAAQMQAALSIGLRPWGALRHVMLPQAVRIAVPPLINRSLILFKDTSLAMVIGVGELTYEVKAIENQTFRSFEVFAVSTALYLAASLALMWLGAWFGRHYPPALRR